MATLTLIAGLVLLVLAGDALVRGSVAAAQRLHIPPLIIGLTIVAFGTSAPELVVSIEAATRGAPGLAIGNVVGSNLTNILLVLGLPAIIAPIILSGEGIRRSVVFMASMSVLLMLFAMDGMIARIEGFVLFALLVTYLTYSGVMASRARKANIVGVDLDDLEDAPLSTFKTVLFILFGIVGLGLGGKLTTDGALGLASQFGVADTVVGLTIVALGTSLPELATSVAAAFRKQTGVVIGNIIGSNIFNILGIAGITAMIVPLGVSPTIMQFDIWVMLAATAALLPIAFLTRRVNRIEGLILTTAYVGYIFLVFRQGMAF